MSDSSLPRRLICCVDGTWCGPDGPNGKGYGNITNIYRIFVSVKEGRCLDNITQQPYFQEKYYEKGIGSADEMGIVNKARAGIRGTRFKDVIQRVYRKCCMLDEKDEVWFYGFSRGAYIVRAVAGLLHYIWALRSAQSEDFDAEYSRALKIYEDAERRRRFGPGQVCRQATMSLREIGLDARLEVYRVANTIASCTIGSQLPSRGLPKYGSLVFSILSKLCTMGNCTTYLSTTLLNIFAMHWHLMRTVKP